MEEKEKTYLEVSSKERDFRLLAADKLLTRMTDEKRTEILKEMFLVAAKNHNDEAANELLKLIGKEYDLEERKIADETDKHYGNADIRANANFYGYLKSIYWELPDRIKTGEERGIFPPYERYPIYGSTLLKTKVQIIKAFIGRWAGYSYGRRYFEEVDEQSLEIFNFLVDAYSGRGKCYVFKEEKEEILKLFREKTDYYFTPEIAEKWLKHPNVPNEIRKIFILARARNGGTKLIERDIKYAEMLKPLEVEKRSSAMLSFCQKFFGEAKEIDEKIKQLIKELSDGPCSKAENFEIIFHGLDDILLHIHYKEEDLISDSAVRKMIQDIRTLVLRPRSGRYAKIMFILWEGQDYHGNIGSLSETVYFGS